MSRRSFLRRQQLWTVQKLTLASKAFDPLVSDSSLDADASKTDNIKERP